MICLARARASAIGMTKPMFEACCWSLLAATAVLIPTTSPAALTSGPPELPELIAASVWMRPVERAALARCRSSGRAPRRCPGSRSARRRGRGRCRWPRPGRRRRPAPEANVAGVMPVASSSWSTAMSLPVSAPTTRRRAILAVDVHHDVPGRPTRRGRWSGRARRCRARCPCRRPGAWARNGPCCTDDVRGDRDDRRFDLGDHAGHVDAAGRGHRRRDWPSTAPAPESSVARPATKPLAPPATAATRVIAAAWSTCAGAGSGSSVGQDDRRSPALPARWVTPAVGTRAGRQVGSAGRAHEGCGWGATWAAPGDASAAGPRGAAGRTCVEAWGRPVRPGQEPREKQARTGRSTRRNTAFTGPGPGSAERGVLRWRPSCSSGRRTRRPDRARPGRASTGGAASSPEPPAGSGPRSPRRSPPRAPCVGLLDVSADVKSVAAGLDAAGWRSPTSPIPRPPVSPRPT